MVHKTAICTALVLAFGAAYAAERTPDVIVEAERQRTLRHEIHDFVSSAVVLPHTDDQTIARWSYKPICPTVAGLTREQGEYVLSRLSEIARGACKNPNLYIIVSADPDDLVKRLEKRSGVFNFEGNRPQLAEFERPRPVRIWYNLGTVSLDGQTVIEMLDTSSARARSSAGMGSSEPIYNNMPSQYGSRLNASTVTHDILSVLEIVDRRSTAGLTTGQLADFVAVAGLAQIDLDKNLGVAPTILSVFKTSAESRSAGVTPWDTALLRALYSVRRTNRMAISEIEDSVFASISMPPSSK
jgi:hypothetical protein